MRGTGAKRGSRHRSREKSVSVAPLNHTVTHNRQRHHSSHIRVQTSLSRVWVTQLTRHRDTRIGRRGGTDYRLQIGGPQRTPFSTARAPGMSAEGYAWAMATASTELNRSDSFELCMEITGHWVSLDSVRPRDQRAVRGLLARCRWRRATASPSRMGGPDG